MSDDHERHGYRRDLHFIPFGRFRADRGIADGQTSVLVGREGHRAFLIDALSGSPRRGAFLITGRRGVGKTTFVESCLREFDANVFRRFLRGRAGRTPLDMVVTLGLLLISVFVSLIASDLMEFMAPQVDRTNFLFIFVVVALLITTLPILYGFRVLSMLARGLSETWSVLLRPVICCAALVYAYMALPLGSPAYSMLLAMIAFATLVPISFLLAPREVPLVRLVLRGDDDERQARKKLSSHWPQIAAETSRFLMVLGLPILLSFGCAWAAHSAIADGLVPAYTLAVAGFESIPGGGYSLLGEVLSPYDALGDVVKLGLMVIPAVLLLLSSAMVATYYSAIYGLGRLAELRKNLDEPEDDDAEARPFVDGMSNEQGLRARKSLLLVVVLLALGIGVILLILPDIIFAGLTENGRSKVVGWLTPPTVGLALGATILAGSFLGFWAAVPSIALRILIAGSLVIFLSWNLPHLPGIGSQIDRVAEAFRHFWLVWTVAVLAAMFATILTIFLYRRPSGSTALPIGLCVLSGLLIAFGIWFDAVETIVFERLLPLWPIVASIGGPCLLFLARSRYRRWRAQNPKDIASGMKDDERRQHMRRLVPPIEALLFLKGVICISIGLQLSYPAIALLPPIFQPNSISAPPPDLIVGGDVVRPMDQVRGLRWPVSINTCLYESQGTLPAQPGEDGCVSNGEENLLTPFGSQFSDEIVWALLLILLFVLVYFSEYEAIARPFISQRQVRSLDRGRRRPHMFHHDLDPAWAEAVMRRADDIIASDKAARREKSGTPNAKASDPPEAAPAHRGRDEMIRGVVMPLERARKARFRALERATFPYVVAHGWVPSLTVRVNLGFDHMDHRGVTHAMLFGLANSYKECFLSWRSPYRIIGLALTTLAVLAAISAAGRAFVDMPYNPERVLTDIVVTDADSPGSALQSAQFCPWLANAGPNGALIPRLLCETFPNRAGSILSIIFAPLVEIDLTLSSPLYPSGGEGEDLRPIFFLLHLNNGLPQFPDAGTTATFLEQTPSLSFRVYHFLLLAIILWLLAFASRRLPILPYRRTLSTIETLMDDLVQSRTKRRKGGRYGLLRMFDQAFRQEEEDERSQAALDPRSVELALMSVLEEIQSQDRARLAGPLLSFSIPTPEVHFLFDELDKIGGVVGAEDTSLGVSEAEQKAVDAERRRTYELHALLSDMKRVISSAPARFIFVGGRALHDEWVRDVNRTGTRQPLLSSIFDAELYLPSLLLDLPRAVFDGPGAIESGAPRSLNARVRQYLARLHEAAVTLDTELQLTRILPFFAAPLRPVSDQDFDEHAFGQALMLPVVDARQRKILPRNDSKLSQHLDDSRWLLNDLVDFLAFRSAGSPKRLRETLHQFVRPAGSMFLPGDVRRFELANDRDMLVIDRPSLYRIQFVAYVFRHIDNKFGEALIQRDDKVAINVFFMFDYLMKLHGRAFSLSSLERLDELAHVHRAPDLRRLLEKVVGDSAEEFFHRMLNGLYSFRFQSDLAMEIAYLSRLSEPEMAALNFTLDESQELKTTYANMLGAAGEPNPDVIVALGELYEYDQAYDVARGHYQRAIRMIDEDIIRQIGPQMSYKNVAPSGPASVPSAIAEAAATTAGMDQTGTIDALLRGDRVAGRALNEYVPWAVRRLRLMIQIGLTFEQVGDEERALAQYHAAHMLARRLTEVFKPLSEDESTPEREGWQSLLLENIPLLFQPLLASAWVSEKLEGSVDTSLSKVELELHEMMSLFPFIKQSGMTATALHPNSFGKSPYSPTKRAADFGANYALFGAEMHNKAGDLYFFKGRVSLSAPEPGTGAKRLLKTWLPEGEEDGARLNSNVQKMKGYLPAARVHYAIGLHEVRRFCAHKKDISRAVINPIDIGDPVSTMAGGAWPSIVHLTAASSLVDLGELMRAGLTLSVLIGARSPKDAREDANLVALYRSDQTLIDGPENGARRSAIVSRRKHRAKGMARRLTVLGDDYLEELSTAYWTWAESHDLEISVLKDNLAGPIHHADLLAGYLGIWDSKASSRASRLTLARKRIQIVCEPSREDAVLLSLFFSIMGAEQTRRGGLPLAAADELEIVLSHIARLMQNAIIIDVLMQRDTSNEDFEARIEGPLMRRLAETGLEVLQRAVRLRKLSGTSNSSDGYRIGTSIPVSLAVAATRFHWLTGEIAGRADDAEERKKLEAVVSEVGKTLTDWFGDTDAATCYDSHYIHNAFETGSEGRTFGTPGDRVVHRQQVRSRLLRMKDRHHFPVLSALEIYKTLVDMTLLEPTNEYKSHLSSDIYGEAERKRQATLEGHKQNNDLLLEEVEELKNLRKMHRLAKSIPERIVARQKEALTWLDELIAQELLVDAPMHFTTTKLAETTALAAVLAQGGTSADQAARIDDAASLIERAEQSFSMGRQYYANINRLYYHYDDFNDRSRHAEHASSMMTADVLALLKASLPEPTET